MNHGESRPVVDSREIAWLESRPSRVVALEVCGALDHAEVVRREAVRRLREPPPLSILVETQPVAIGSDPETLAVCPILDERTEGADVAAAHQARGLPPLLGEDRARDA